MKPLRGISTNRPSLELALTFTSSQAAACGARAFIEAHFAWASRMEGLLASASRVTVASVSVPAGFGKSGGSASAEIGQRNGQSKREKIFMTLRSGFHG